MPFMVGKRKSPEKGLKLRTQVACCATEIVITPVPAGALVAIAATVAVGSTMAATVSVGAATGAVVEVAAAGGIGVAAGDSVPQAVRMRESTTHKGRSSCSLECLFTRIKFIFEPPYSLG